MDPTEPPAGTIALFGLVGLAFFFAFNRQEALQSNILLGLVAITFPPIVGKFSFLVHSQYTYQCTNADIAFLRFS